MKNQTLPVQSKKSQISQKGCWKENTCPRLSRMLYQKIKHLPLSSQKISFLKFNSQTMILERLLHILVRTAFFRTEFILFFQVSCASMAKKRVINETLYKHVTMSSKPSKFNINSRLTILSNNCQVFKKSESTKKLSLNSCQKIICLKMNNFSVPSGIRADRKTGLRN